MRFIVLFILAYLPQAIENCDARFDVIYERYNCSCSTALEKLPDHCEDFREEVLQTYNDFKKVCLVMKRKSVQINSSLF